MPTHWMFWKNRLCWNISLSIFWALFIIIFLIEDLSHLPDTLKAEGFFKTLGISFMTAGFSTVAILFILKTKLFKVLIKVKDKLQMAIEDPIHPEKYLTLSTRTDEIGILLGIINQMLKRMSDSFKNIKAHEAIFKLRLEERAQELSQQENYDFVTGLPNRELFIKKTNECIKELSFEKKQTGTLIIEINNYKEVIDRLTLQNQNILLTMITKTLENSLPPLSILARIASDQFSITREISDRTQFGNLSAWILYRLTHPFMIENESILLSVNGGASTTPQDGDTAEILVRNAHHALNLAKMNMRNTLQFYQSGMDAQVQYQKNLLADLYHAIEQNELLVYYQPKVHLTSNKITGMEALVRWKHPTKGLVSPIDYIPLAEESGLIIPIGEWVLRTACEQTKLWNEKGLNLIVAVNLSTIQFRQKNLLEMINRVLLETKFPPEHLELEITESGIMDNIQESIGIMKALHGLGISLSIDDFGTGNSSLSYLKRFPIQKLKIDQAFIKDLENNQDDKDITEVIINLGHTLKLQIIAEGIETENHVAFLKSKQCDYGQGYYWSKPVDKDAFFNLVSSSL